jgi:integrase
MIDITAFWATLKNQHSVYVEARKAQILTMASPRDVCGMRWLDIDLQRAVWTVHGKELFIPLSKPMIEMLTNVLQLSGISARLSFDDSTGGPLPPEFLCFGARDIREAFDVWASAQAARSILDAWTDCVMGGQMSDAREITVALGGKWYGRYGLAFCPAHHNLEISFGFRK